jgi:hypothetical protein
VELTGTRFHRWLRVGDRTLSPYSCVKYNTVKAPGESGTIIVFHEVFRR